MADAMPVVLLLAGDLSLGGQGRWVGELAAELANRQVITQVVCLAGAKKVEPPVAEIVESPGLSNRWLRLLVTRQLRRIGDSASPRLFHILDIDMAEAGLRLAEFWRLPYVLTVNEFPSSGQRFRISHRWCRAVVAELPELAEQLIQAHGIAPDQIRLIRPGFRWGRGRDRSPWSHASSSGGLPVIGTSGRLAPGFGQETFLEAARMVLGTGVAAEFLIAGGGPSEHALRQSAQRLGIAEQVTFTSEPDLDGSFWKVLDLYCQPALVPSSGRALATAMAFGVPSILTDVEGLRTFAAEGANGLLIPPRDSNALAQGILDLLADPVRAERFARKARAEVRARFNAERQADELIALYFEVLGNEGASDSV